MDNNTNPLYNDPQQQVYNPLHPDQEVLYVADPMALDIPDEDLVDIVRKRIKDDEKFYEANYNLKARRQKNEMYLFGRQTDQSEKDGKLKDYETRSSDNVLYEIEASLKPLAMSKLPDILVTPGGEDPERKESSKNLSIVVNDMNKKREQRELLGLGFKHLPVYFTAVLKARWDSEKGKSGDFRFDAINPVYIVVDHTASSRNPDDMSHIAQVCPMKVQDVIMKFPKKKKELFDALKFMSVESGNEPTWKDLASEINIWEVWFDWYKKKGTKETVTKEEYNSIYEPGEKWERVSGVLWMYQDVLLDKMLDPNYDHEGEDVYFSYAVPGDETTRQEVKPEDLLMSALSGQPIPGLVQEKVYHNYFTRPHKPYYFFGYDQWGKIVYDETSRIEQNIRNQENLDDQNRTILDQIKSRVKHIWGADSGLTKADIQRLDMDDPKMDVRVTGDPNGVHKSINPERPDNAQFNALSDTKSRMFGLAGATALQGKLQSDVATSNQIAREADFTRADDLVEDTINAACEWFAQWQMHYIKLRYSEDHMTEILGAKGEATYIKLRRDMISDGMEVVIKASSTDKLRAQRNAMDMAKLGPPFTDPIRFFEDMDMADPKGRAEAGMIFMTDPNTYMAKYIMGLQDTNAMAGALTAGLPPMDGGQAPMPGQQPTPMGGQQMNPANATPTDTTQVATQPPAIPQGSPRMM